MKSLASVSLVLLLGASPPIAAAQQAPASAAAAGPATSLARAEAAFGRGSYVEAAREYRAVLRANPNHPRALFRLAQLNRDDPKTAVVLLERYVALEPSDAWGHLVLAQAAADLGHEADALRAYEAAFARAPKDRDIVLGRPRLNARLGRIDEAIQAYEAWLVTHRDDAEAWRELADQRQRAGYLQSAADALQRARGLNPGDRQLETRLQALLSRAAPAIEMGIIGASETDIGTRGLSLGGDFAAGDRWRVAFGFDRAHLESFGAIAQSRRLIGQTRFKPRADLQVDASGGFVRVTPEDDESRTEPDLNLRVRKNTFSNGVRVDVRARRGPVTVSPDLMRLGLTRSQVQTMVEVPVNGTVRFRGQARLGAFTREGEQNIRTGWGGGPVVALAPGVQLVGQWFQTSHSQTTAIGYFAPRRAEQIDAGFEVDAERGDFTISLDAGGGLQRFQRHGESPMGGWAPALRLWGLVAWTIKPGQQIRVEVESYDAHVADAVAATERWRYTSLTATLRVGFK